MESDKYLRYLDDVVESIKDCPNGRNKCTVLIGAGCSVTAGIPVSSGIVDKIQKEYPEAYKRADPKKYSNCMEMLAPEQRRGIINYYIEKAKINWAHLCLAKLMDAGYVDRILTTNFDPLALRACALLGRVPAVYDITSFTAEFKSNVIPDKAVFYLHGQCTGFKLVHTEKEAVDNIKNLLPFFEDSLQGRTWIIVGYSGTDPVFNELGKVDCFDNNLFWVCYDHEPAVHIREKLLLDGKYAFYLKNYNADDFFINLTQQLGCFPEIATKPFSHIKSLLEKITDFPIESRDDKKDITKEGFQLIEEAIKQHEKKPFKIDTSKDDLSELMYAKGLLSEARYDELINLIDASIIKASDGWKDLIVLAFFGKGASLLRKSDQEFGYNKEALLNEVINIFDQASKLKPDNPDIINNKAAVLDRKAFLKTGDERENLFTEAIKLYDQALKLRPNDSRYLDNKAIALSHKAELKSSNEKESMLDEIISLYNQALKLKPDNPDYLNNEAKALDQKAELKSSNEKESLLNEAIYLCDKAIKLKPDSPRYLDNKAVIISHIAELKSEDEKESLLNEAIDFSSQAVKLGPNNSDYLNNRGVALQKKSAIKKGEEKEELLNEAISMYDKVINLKKDSAEPINNKGAALHKKAELKRGKEKENLLSKAKSMYDMAIKLEPDNLSYKYNKVTLLLDEAELKNDKEKEDLLNKAIQLLNHLLMLSPANSVYLNQKGVALYNKAKIITGKEKEQLLDKALKTINYAIKESPNDPICHTSEVIIILDIIKLRSGKERENLIKRANLRMLNMEKVKPGIVAYNLACLMALSGKEEECREWLFKSLKGDNLPNLHHIEKDDDLREYRDKDWFKDFLLKVKEKSESI